MEFASGEEFSLWLANAMTTFAGSKQPAPQEERNRAVNPTETPKIRGRQWKLPPLIFVVAQVDAMTYSPATGTLVGYRRNNKK